MEPRSSPSHLLEELLDRVEELVDAVEELCGIRLSSEAMVVRSADLQAVRDATAAVEGSLDEYTEMGGV